MAGTGYSRLQIRLHWAVALLVAIQLGYHGAVVAAYEASLQTGVFRFSPGVVVHFVVGTAILLAVALRLSLPPGRPPRPMGGPGGKVMTTTLYVVLVLQPVTGVIAWGFSASVARALHGLTGQFLTVLVALHVLWVLYDHIIRKSGILQKMWAPDP